MEGAKLLEQEPTPLSYKPLKPKQWTLSNELTVLFRHDDELPLVQGALLVKGGGLWESKEEVGVIEAMGDQLRQGGAGNLSANELDERLEELSAAVDSNFADEYGVVSFSCLSDDFEAVFARFADIILKPKFEQARLDLWKGIRIEQILRRKDDPENIAQIAFRELLYGATPYGRVVMEADVNSISRLKILRAHRKLMRPHTSYLVITGKIDQQKLMTAVQKQFKDWERSSGTLGPAPPIKHEPQPGLYFIEHPSVQATIFMGHLGVPRFTKDYIAINGFNELFGSGTLGSRLMDRLREELGLAYWVYGTIAPGPVKGKNMIAIRTKAESTAEALVESLKLLEQLQEEAVGQEELSNMKLAIQNSFVFKTDTPYKALKRMAFQKILGFPKDYDETFVRKTLELQASDIQQTASSRWDLDRFVVVVVGNRTAYNLIVTLMEEPPAILDGYGVKPVHFDKRLVR
ncbi:insulinase family protein [Oligoflexia bacterium]|nr:insulinase family protein [Oligoflexia bacterium]